MYLACRICGAIRIDGATRTDLTQEEAMILVLRASMQHQVACGITATPPPRCAQCGDTEIGPWGMYRGRFLCEHCGEQDAANLH